ncbi:MAG: rod shape-determining protein RodA, partial [Chloroflexota bacterium]|nr:rod shape-determining protein RodA [Chloroflexota bacterium]
MSSRILSWGGAGALRSGDAAGTARWKHFDWVMFASTLLLCVVGLVMIYSTTSEPGPFAPSVFLVKQAAYLAFGLVLMAVTATLDYRFLQNWTWPIYAGTIALLAALLVIGRTTHGSTRWIDVGPVPIQPSELAKLTTALVLARFLSERPRGQSSLVRFLVSLGLVLVPLGLVFIQPDLGTSMVLGALWLALILVSGTRIRYLLWLCLAALPAVLAGWTFLLKPYQKARVASFLNPEASPLGEGYNLIQARISIGAGGFRGQGFMEGSQSQLHYLRVQHTDFIASVIGEEFGFLGMIALLLVFSLLLVRIIRAADIARDTYGELLAAGIGAIILFQVFVNLGMNMGLM